MPWPTFALQSKLVICKTQRDKQRHTWYVVTSDPDP